ncbi:MAG: TrkA family potassium uptake protein [Chloroflexi bacterium]|nr:TrkA family potassium uptake protein [Chloroflexota bacterium]
MPVTNSRHIVVVGLGRFGSSIARTLYQLGHTVIAIDNDENRVQAMMGEVTHPVVGNATDESVLRDFGVHNYDIGIVAIGSNVEASIMVTVLFQTMNLPYVVARAQSELHGSTLERLGCQKVVYAETEMGARVAHSLFNPEVEEYLELGPSFGVSRLRVPDRFSDMTLKEAGFAGVRDKYGVAVVAIKRGNNITLGPDADERLHRDDVLVVAGRDELVERISH